MKKLITRNWIPLVVVFVVRLFFADMFTLATLSMPGLLGRLTAYLLESLIVVFLFRVVQSLFKKE